jgi:DNA invertase Pin-like site-specific DNA recombinase
VARLAEREGLALFRGKRPRWDVERARRMRAENVTYREIADDVGVGIMTVWRKLNPSRAAAQPAVAKAEQQ